MPAFDSIYKKMAAALEQSGAGNAPPSQKSDPARQVTPALAHELNNILSIIQGYADRVLLKHGEDLTLVPHLKVISEAAKRAATIVREATPSNGSTESGQRENPPPPQPPTV